VASDQLLSRLRALAIGRRSLGDCNLILRPNPTSEEQYEQAEERSRILGPKQGHVILSGSPGDGDHKK